MDLEQIELRRAAQAVALKNNLLTAFAKAKEHLLKPIKLSSDVDVNDAYSAYATETYATLIDLAITDLQSVGCITPPVLECFDAALKVFPAETLNEMPAKDTNEYELNRRYLQIYYLRFKDTLDEPIKEAKKAYPAPV